MHIRLSSLGNVPAAKADAPDADTSGVCFSDTGAHVRDTGTPLLSTASGPLPLSSRLAQLLRLILSRRALIGTLTVLTTHSKVLKSS